VHNRRVFHSLILLQKISYRGWNSTLYINENSTKWTDGKTIEVAGTELVNENKKK